MEEQLGHSKCFSYCQFIRYLYKIGVKIQLHTMNIKDSVT